VAEKPLSQKLLIKPGHQVRVFNAPENYHAMLGEIPENVQIADEGSGEFDVVHVFARDSQVLNRDAPQALEAIKPGGILWFFYPKRSSQVETDITRDHGWEVLNTARWRPVTQVSIDETWSALRFRPIADVGREFNPGGKK